MCCIFTEIWTAIQSHLRKCHKCPTFRGRFPVVFKGMAPQKKQNERRNVAYTVMFSSQDKILTYRNLHLKDYFCKQL